MIIWEQENPTKVVDRYFPDTITERSKDPPYYTFYKTKRAQVPEGEMKFVAPLQERCDE